MSLLDTNITVRFGEKQLKLRDVIAHAAQVDGMAYVIVDKLGAPREPKAWAVDRKGYETELGKFFGCHDSRTAIDIETGRENKLFDVIRRNREAGAAKLEA